MAGYPANRNRISGTSLKLVGVLLRFRQDRIAVMADIESMFHQVKVNVHHRDYLRFLWWPNGLLSDKPSVFRMNVHLFGGIWSPSCCNFVLKYTAKEHQSEYSDEVVKVVSDNFYVDDFLKSFATVNEATQLVQQVGSLLEKGGFRLTKWVSNSEEVISAIPPAERSDRGCCLCLPSGGTLERALGVKWNTLTDTFSFSTIDTNKPATRRGILSIVSSLYDLLDLSAHSFSLLNDCCRNFVERTLAGMTVFQYRNSILASLV